MTIRQFEVRDHTVVRQIVIDTGVFNEEEIAIADELMQITLHQPQQKDYEIFVCVDEQDVPAGYFCIGPTPATVGTYDLYWIAVDPHVQQKGIGRTLLKFAEEYLASKGAYLIVAETSSTPKYDQTRAFYLRNGYEVLAQIKKYYKPDDDLVVFGKYLSQ